MRPTPDPFRTPESGQAAIAEAHAAIDQMERDARERREREAARKAEIAARRMAIFGR